MMAIVWLCISIVVGVIYIYFFFDIGDDKDCIYELLIFGVAILIKAISFIFVY